MLFLFQRFDQDRDDLFSGPDLRNEDPRTIPAIRSYFLNDPIAGKFEFLFLHNISIVTTMYKLGGYIITLLSQCDRRVTTDGAQSNSHR